MKHVNDFYSSSTHVPDEEFLYFKWVFIHPSAVDLGVQHFEHCMGFARFLVSDL